MNNIDGDAEVLGIVLAIVAVIGTWFVCCLGVGHIAQQRGHSRKFFLLLSIFFSPLISYLFLVALPVHEITESGSPEREREDGWFDTIMGGLVSVVVVGGFMLVRSGCRDAEDKRKAQEVVPDADPVVYFDYSGSYHASEVCPYREIPREGFEHLSYASANGYRPCPHCYPWAGDSSLLVPRVQVYYDGFAEGRAKIRLQVADETFRLVPRPHEFIFERWYFYRVLSGEKTIILMNADTGMTATVVAGNSIGLP